REAQSAGALVHPNIVAVHDIGKDPATGSPYIVMEHVPGQDLKKVILSRAPLSGTEAVGIVQQIAAALDYAHRRGVGHRDIKPAEPPSETHTDVSPDFDAILEKALAKDPDQRYQTGQEMLAALAHLVEEESPAAGAETPATEGGREVTVVASPWFTLTSQWRLGALVAFLVMALIGVNWAIVSLLHGPLGQSVRLDGDLGEPASGGSGHHAHRGTISIAGASVPAASERAAG